MIDAAAALKSVRKFLEKPCALTVPENPKLWGRGPDDWPAILFDWSALPASERETFIIDRLADTFPDPAALTPFLLLGPSGLHARGAGVADADQVDGILFLDLKRAAKGRCPVLLWNTDEPAGKLRQVADDPGKLPLKVITPAAPKKEDPDRLPYYVVKEGPSAPFGLLQDDNSLGLVAMEGTLKKGKIDYAGVKVASLGKSPGAAEQKAAALAWRAAKVAEGFVAKPFTG